jgi:hypothetical protein
LRWTAEVKKQKKTDAKVGFLFIQVIWLIISGEKAQLYSPNRHLFTKWPRPQAEYCGAAMKGSTPPLGMVPQTSPFWKVDHKSYSKGQEPL